ncbi:MAG: dockerin type I repeat-containing protein [Clostridia bacterium]|nr:dockerin type I repeat-containing protein [Clostridia bacterium]
MTAPTCTDRGYATHTCSKCGDSYVDTYVPALGHDFGEWRELDGESHVRICSHNAEHTESAAHEWDDGVITTPATMTSAGVKTYTCTVCGATINENVLPAAKIGDVDGDGILTLKDISHLKAYIAGVVNASDISSENSDIDGDGTIGLKDISAIKVLIAG